MLRNVTCSVVNYIATCALPRAIGIGHMCVIQSDVLDSDRFS